MNLAWQDARYADLYEQTLYNGLLGALDLAGTAFYYTNPLDANAHRTPWHNCPCCVGNIPRTHPHAADLDVREGRRGSLRQPVHRQRVTIDDVAGTGVEMVQTTNYPWDGKVSITVNPAVAKRFAVRIRVPDRDVSSSTSRRRKRTASRPSRSTAAGSSRRSRTDTRRSHARGRPAIGSSSSCR